jgi:hypothetical protein|tara:strand:- start:35 stop:256 length:222 start_codon:yes stop_codon:yes gene_type:complete
MKLKDLLTEDRSDRINVSGIGTYDYTTLKKKVQIMSNDLAKNAKKGLWRKSSRNDLRAFAEMWGALSRYEEKR